MHHRHDARYPFLWVQTTEEERIIRENRTKFGNEVQFFSWDIVAGFQGLIQNGSADSWAWQPFTTDKKKIVSDPGAALETVSTLPENSMIFMKDFHKYFEKITISRAALNLKENLKLNAKTICFLSAENKIPPELANDITMYDYSYPDEKALMKIVDKMAEDNQIPAPKSKEADTIVNAMRGLTWEGAENALALSLVINGNFDVKNILKQKAAQLKAGGILEFGTFDERLSDLYGLEVMKKYIMRTIGNAKARGILIYGIPGTGKCLGKGTLILKYNGSRCLVENIRVGDLLMGPDSNPRKVLETVQGFGPLYRVTPVKGAPYIVNERHVLSLKKTGGNRIRNIPIKKYLTGISPRWKGWRTGVEWEKKDLLIPPYILGAWLGDGDSDRTAFTINNTDRVILEEITQYVRDSNLILQKDKTDHRGATRYRVVSQVGRGGRPKNLFLDHLRALKVLHNKHIPSVYRINDRKNRLELLAGLIDTDGHLNNGGYEIVTKFKKLSNNILFLARSLGFAAYVSQKIVRTNGKRLRYHRVFISGDLSKLPVRIPRRKAKPRKQVKDVLKTGITVQPIGEGKYYGFELDGDHLFLLGDFTVTHNSHTAKAVANEMGWPCLILRFSALKDKYQGVAEGRLRDAFKTIRAVGKCVVFMDEIEAIASGISSGGDNGVGQALFKDLLVELEDSRGCGAYWIGTCNALEPLIHESGGAILRRFNGIFFADMPLPDEARGIADIWSKKEGVKIPNDYPLDGYSGADIAKLAETMSMMECSAEEAGQYILPYGKAHANELEDIRRKAEGVCIWAGKREGESGTVIAESSRKVRKKEPLKEIENDTR